MESSTLTRPTSMLNLKTLKAREYSFAPNQKGCFRVASSNIKLWNECVGYQGVYFKEIVSLLISVLLNTTSGSILLTHLMDVCLYIYIYIYIYRPTGIMVRVFATGLGDRDSSLSRFIPKTQKLYLMLPCLTFSFIRYASRVNGATQGKK